MKTRYWSAIVMLLLSAFVLSCRAASFNCNGQISNIESAICNNKELSLLDEQLAEAFSVLRARFGSVALHDQRRWLMSRDMCKADVKCLKHSYENRITLLAMPKYEPRPRWGTGLNALPPTTISNLDSNHTIDAVLQKCHSEPACREYASLAISRFSKSTLLPQAAVIDQLQHCQEGNSNSAICWAFRATFLENELADRIKFALRDTDQTCEMRMDRKQFLWEHRIYTECDRIPSTDLDFSQYSQVLSYCRGDKIRDRIGVLKEIGTCQPCSKCLAAW
jgi:uncharacterized protein